MTLIVGTNRPGSNTRKVAKQIEGLYAELRTPLHVLDLAHLPPSLFDPGSYGEKPAAFKPFSDAVVNASGLSVVTPGITDFRLLCAGMGGDYPWRMILPKFATVLFVSFTFASFAEILPKPDITVAADGSGDFKTVQAAVASIPKSNRERMVV